MTPDELAAALLDWFAGAARPLPWRGETDPYRVWLSEVMLQQTQVATVEPYYERFLGRFPTVETLAAAELEEVLTLWQGLGYYRRARNLWAAARQVTDELGGVWPTTAAGWRRLPGVGEYTAGALASIVGGEATPAVDGNVERVFARLDALPLDPTRGPGRRALRRRVAALLVHGPPGWLNQALMELGATVCAPAEPRCDACPLAVACRARATGEPTRWPRRTPAPPPREMVHVCAVCRRGEALLLLRRPPTGRWAGLWELPRIELPRAEFSLARAAVDLGRLLGQRVELTGELARLNHAISGEKILLIAQAARLAGEPTGELAWLTPPLDRPLATSQRRLLELLADG